MTKLIFAEIARGEHISVQVSRLLVVGFTGRDREAVEEHISELAGMGVPVPEAVPSLYRLEPDRLTQDRGITVNGTNTSGEVEPVVVRAEGRWLLTVGSDHTDRDLERRDIHASKAACPKVIATTCMELSRVKGWDDVEISSRVDAGGVLYQQGRLASLLPLEIILERLADEHGVRPADGDVLFLGTVPTRGGIRPSATFEATLAAPGLDQQITLSYSVADESDRTSQEESHT